MLKYSKLNFNICGGKLSHRQCSSVCLSVSVGNGILLFLTQRREEEPTLFRTACRTYTSGVTFCILPLLFVWFRASTPSVLLSNGFLLFLPDLFLLPASFLFLLQDINLQGLIINSAKFVTYLGNFLSNVVIPIKLIMTVCCKDKTLSNSS